MNLEIGQTELNLLWIVLGAVFVGFIANEVAGIFEGFKKLIVKKIEEPKKEKEFIIDCKIDQKTLPYFGTGQKYGDSLDYVSASCGRA